MSAVDAKASKKRKAEASSAAFDEAAAAAGEKAKKPKKTPEEKAAKAAKKAAKAAKAAKEAAAAEGAAPAAAAEGAAPAAAPAAAAEKKRRGGPSSATSRTRARGGCGLCVYGGSAYGPSCDALRRGVDVVVGTPGRTMDLIEKGVLDASALSFAVLDEADQMLDMGFKDELEKIFAAMAPAGARAGAPAPPLLRDAAALGPQHRQGLRADRRALEAIDLAAPAARARDGLGGIVCQASTDVSHKCVPVASWSMNHKVINDVALREKTMAAFRAGQFKILVATDVAARGLDMVVELVVNNKPPATRSGWADAETYVHRSGRTGRAGRKGTCVTLYQTKHRATLEEIERKTKNAFDWVGAPRARDVLSAAADAALRAVEDVAPSAPLLRGPRRGPRGDLRGPPRLLGDGRLR
ncbi:helicase [Aureococcus anophagefferens]|nr:helicase [Aureococcus anophagefferens]